MDPHRLATPWLRQAFALVLLLSLAACGSEDGDTAGEVADGSGSGQLDATDAAGDATGGSDVTGVVLDPPRTLTFCGGGTEARYDPIAGTGLDSFPDDAWTRADPTTGTGLRLDVHQGTPWLGWLPGSFQSVFLDLVALDGFGVNADLFVRFAGPVAMPGSGTATAVDGPLPVELWALPADGDAERIPYEARRTDDGATLVIAPMRPLRAKTRHALIVRASLGDAAGDCLRPSPFGRALLERRLDPLVPAAAHDHYAALAQRWQAALDAAGIDAAAVAAVRVFTTQSTVDDSVAIAADIRSRDVAWIEPSCTEPAGKKWRLCEVSFDAWDYRDGFHIEGRVGKTLRRHTARVWLPKEGSGPFPTIVFGHGLTGARAQGDKLADFAAPVGFAAIAIDAVYHGAHPAGSAKSLGGVLGFFGIDPAKLSFDFLRLRDNFRQSTYEKLQLIEAIRRHPDFDGDGKNDFDPSALGYLGVSLGGLMGPELLALSPDLRVGVLSVPGAKVTSIIQSSEQFAPIIQAFKPAGSSDGDVERFFCVLQAIVDPGDGGSYAPHVLRDRLAGAGAGAPHLLIQMAIDDDIVPNVATRALIRALDIPVVGTVLQPVGLVAEGVALPSSANVEVAPGQKVTVGAFQFDRLRDKKGDKVQKADHSGTPASYEAMTQDLHFVSQWRDGKAEIVDPYVVTSTPPLP